MLKQFKPLVLDVFQNILERCDDIETSLYVSQDLGTIQFNLIHIMICYFLLISLQTHILTSSNSANFDITISF